MLGAAAGGGFPQWNCACAVCRLAWDGDPRVRPATQASIAVSATADDWVILGAAPDIRQQILQTRELWPRRSGRDSPIAGVVLLGAEVDAMAGLLALRERQSFRLFAAAPVVALLRANPMFAALDPAVVQTVEVPPDTKVDCGAGLTLRLLPIPGKAPLYLEGRAAPEDATYAAIVGDSRATMLAAPACAVVTEAFRAAAMAAEAVFLDGTLYQDDEIVAAGLGAKTARRMGHLPLAGADGSLAQLHDLPGRRILFHINNTNPIHIEGSPERRRVEEAGWEVAFDGMRVKPGERRT